MPNTFASDNNATVHPKILEALGRINEGHVRAYGDDPVTTRAVAKMREHFGKSAEVFFVFNGTGAKGLPEFSGKAGIRALKYGNPMPAMLSRIYAQKNRLVRGTSETPRSPD
jgi:hypothetical protein